MIKVKVREPLEKIIVNRLFLIGNGFDLSLGLKTKYSDFLLWFLKREIVNAINSRIDEAPFEKYKGNFDSFTERYYKLRVNGYSENKLFDVLINYSSYKITEDKVSEIQNLNDLFKFNERYGIQIKAPVDYLLINSLLETSKENWIDIENTYFELLKKMLNTRDNKEKNKSNIEIINHELTEITFYLKEYLNNLDINIDKNSASNHFRQFDNSLEVSDLSEFNTSHNVIKLGLNYFLNFNYTDSLTKLLNNYKSYNYQQNHIHGNLIRDEIIFGFGDEMDSVYRQIEDLNDNRYFEHIKSFQYFKTSNLRRLQTFLNSDFYQVCIYGHSCGLSDRVMLNEIFEHENCKSIKIYYYSDDDFTTKTMEISRHFNSNKEMRKKIVNKNVNCLIPQKE